MKAGTVGGLKPEDSLIIEAAKSNLDTYAGQVDQYQPTKRVIFPNLVKP